MRNSIIAFTRGIVAYLTSFVKSYFVELQIFSPSAGLEFYREETTRGETPFKEIAPAKQVPKFASQLLRGCPLLTPLP